MLSPSPTVQVFDSLSASYREAFEAFLAHTDQKVNAQAFLSRVVSGLPSRRLFIDVGAGEGGTTRHLAPDFLRTVAVEPSVHLHEALGRACPQAVIVAEPVADAKITERADLVLCSHVLYYLPRAEWVATVARMLEWVTDGGELVVMLQNPGSDCMRMLRHFTGVAFDLAALRRELVAAGACPTAAASVEPVPAMVRTPDADTAVTIAEFMLNLVPLSQLSALPTRAELHEYVARYFAAEDGGFAFSSTQDCLRLRKVPASTPV
ncbi:methyltransferase domain-containing protein [Streptomyces sp. NPDC051133]|uniref:class I SAM-dependent methyltransferase n=1 Tax=Streptomyces sp. NPDC051133 TaxID=3155521 RepID=UPI003427A0FE